MFRGDLLKEWRTSHSLSQEACAKKISVTQSMWTLLERGKVEPSTDTLVSIARLTGISVDALLGNPTQPPLTQTEAGDREAV